VQVRYGEGLAIHTGPKPCVPRPDTPGFSAPNMAARSTRRTRTSVSCSTSISGRMKKAFGYGLKNGEGVGYST
jgi:hypothetical protein